MNHLCLIFEATGPYNAIGKVALAQVEAALAAGWRVSVVAKRLCESLQPRVEWLRLFVPPRGFALQWLTARRFIRKAMGDASRFDAIVGHQPQIADLCDLFQCHFLTREAYEHGVLLDARGPRRIAEWAQKRAVLAAEDRHYRKWNPSTRMLFNSALTRERFAHHYGLPRACEVLTYPSPPWNPASESERDAARRELGLPARGVVLGFLGGLHERKGYRTVISSLRGQRDVTLLFGGLHADGFDAAELAGHFRCVGLVRDTPRFYAACDAIVLASVFEPFGYVASEAASRGVPTIATRACGVLSHLLEHEAGVAWDGSDDLAPLVRRIVDESNRFRAGCERFTEAFSRERHDARFVELISAGASRSPATGEAVFA